MEDAMYDVSELKIIAGYKPAPNPVMAVV